MRLLDKPVRWALIIILVLATALRFYGLKDFSLSNDELSALARCLQPDLLALWENSVKTGDLHPAGVQTFLYFWTRLFGEDPFFLRLPFVICGILSVLVLFNVTRLWAGVYAALSAAALLAVLEYPILYSRLARPYAPGLFFALITLYCWTRVLFISQEERVPKIHYVWMAISMTICMYTHHFCALFVGFLGIGGLLFVTRTNWKGFFLSGASALVLYLPHLGITSYQMGIGGVGGEDGWLPPPEEGWLGEYWDYALNGTTMIGVLVLMTLTRWIMSRDHHSKIKYIVFGTVLGLAMIFVAYWYSIYRNPIFQHSILLFSFPLLLITISFLITPVRRNMALCFAGVILVTGILTTTFSNTFYSTEHFGEFKAIAEHTQDWTEKYGSENITYATNVNAPYYAQFYLEDSVPFRTYLVKNEEDLFTFDSLVSNSLTPYFLYSWSTIQHRPEAYAILRSTYPYIVEDEFHFNSRVTLFSKNEGKVAAPMFQQIYASGDGWIDTKVGNNPIKDSLFFSMSAKEEYSPTFKGQLSEMGYEPGTVCQLQLSVDVRYDDNSEIIIVLESLINGERQDWRGMNANNYYPDPEKWRSIHVVKELDSSTDTLTEIKAYLWSRASTKVDCQNFRITLLEDI